MTIKIKLNSDQTRTVIDQDLLAEAEIVSKAHSTITSNQFVFFAAFDGTNNDQKHDGNINSTNVEALWKQYESTMSGNSNLGGKYYAGLGTAGTYLGSSWIPWQVTDEARRIANNAYNEFTRQAR
jgi:hypothetical protein